VRNHRFQESVLREYDIRGVVGETLGEDDAYAVGRGFATVAASRGLGRIVVGYDGRLTSVMLEGALVAGLTEAGMEVRRIGLGPTPMLYFAVHHLDADGGIMVTGSHNPPNFNGFKLTLGKAPFYGAEIGDLGRMAEAGDWASADGRSGEDDVAEPYLDLLARTYTSDRDLKVVWDCGHGAAGEIVTTLTDRLPGRHRVLFGQIDGTFPAHHPDPTVAENLDDLIRAVRADGADLGFAFDGDGDRIGVVDERGRIIWGDQLLAILARDVLAAQPGATVLADVKASQILFDEIARLGGRPEMCKTGHSVIKSRMAEIGAPLAGEMSGHIFFADKFFGHDDAIYASLRLLDHMAHTGSTAGALLDSLPRVVNTPEIRIECDDARKFQVPGEVEDRLRAAGASYSDIDGVRTKTEDGWWLIRASNTQPALVVRCEAADEAGLARLRAALRHQLEASGLDAQALE
jgi:phosphomannomutase